MVDNVDGSAAIYHMYMNGSFIRKSKEDSNILQDMKIDNTRSTQLYYQHFVWKIIHIN